MITINNKPKKLKDQYIKNNNDSKLVSSQWLKKLIENDQAYIRSEYRIIFVGLGEYGLYNSGFIPGSMYLDTNKIEGGPLWNIVSLEKLQQLLFQFGISEETTVIFYGEKTMAVTRATWAFMYAGVKDVRVLDGGIQGWKALNFATEDKPFMEQGDKVSLIQIKPQTKYLSNISDVKEHQYDKSTVIVDVRSRKEYTGEVSGYEYIKAKGRIPNAVWGHAGTDAYHMEDYEISHGFFRSCDEIRLLWEPSGITPDKNVIFYCGTGWRASEAFFIAHLMGWPNISVYDGGWYEWSSKL